MPTSRTKREATQAQDVEVPQSRTEIHLIRPADTTTPAFLGLIPGAAAQPTLVRGVGELEPMIGQRVQQNTMATVLPDAVYGFFANGGGQCYVVPCPSMDPTAVRVSINALERIPDVSMVAVPGLWQADHPDAVLIAVAEHCVRLGTRVALIDLPSDIGPESVRSVLPTLSPIQQQFTAVFHPWLQITGNGGERMVPPCGVIAGALARNDRNRGVGKAPAVLEVMDYPMVTGLANDRMRLRDGENAVNILRALSAGNATVESVRTLSSEPHFKYLNVRRLICFLTDSIRQGTTWATFEPNNEEVWSAIHRDVTAFLSDLWDKGALMGSTPDEAFHVSCDKTNNTLSGQEITIDIGVAPARPAEFVTFTIRQISQAAR